MECRQVDAVVGVQVTDGDGIDVGQRDEPLQRSERSVAEVDHQDLWQRSTIAVAATGAEGFHVRKVMQQVERFVEAWGGVEVIEAELTLHHPDA